MKTNFLPKKRPDGLYTIILNCSDGMEEMSSGRKKAVRFNLSTGITVEPNTWDKSNKRVKGRGKDAYKINAKLDDIAKALDLIMEKTFDIEVIKSSISAFLSARFDAPEAVAENIVETLEIGEDSEKTLTLGTAISTIMSDYDNGVLRKKNRQMLSKESLNTVHIFAKKYLTFVKEYGDIDLVKYSFDKCLSPSARKKAYAKHTSHFHNFYTFLEEQGHLQNTILTYGRNYKSVYTLLESKYYMNLGGVQKEFSVSPDEFEPVVIPFKLFAQLFHNEKEYRNMLSTTTNAYYDYLLVAGVVGLRKSDMLNNERTQLIERDGAFYVCSVSRKTKTPTMLQIDGRLAEICQNNVKMHGTIIPPLKEKVLTYHIRNILKTVPGFDYTYTSYRVIKGVRQQYKSGPFHDFISSHVLRKTAATNMAVAGVNVQFIKKFCGWSPSSDTLERRYLGNLEAQANPEMNKLYSKIAEMKIAV